MIAGHRGVAPDQFVGQPLRSVLPALCATGKIQMPNNSEAVDVPFAFASLYAGIAGFVMLLKDCINEEKASYGWTQHIFKQPTRHMYRPTYINPVDKCLSAISRWQRLTVRIRAKLRETANKPMTQLAQLPDG